MSGLVILTKWSVNGTVYPVNKLCGGTPANGSFEIKIVLAPLQELGVIVKCPSEG